MASDHHIAHKPDLVGSHSSRQDSEEFNRVVELLEFEITQIRAEESQPGWTVWALVGGIATTLWLLAIEIEQHGANLQNIALVYLVLSLALRVIKVLYRVISPNEAIMKSAFRFQHTHSILSTTRASILLDIAHCVIFILIVASLRQVLRPSVSTISYVVFGILQLVFLGAFVLSYLKIPITDYQTSRVRQMSPVAYLLLGVAVFVLIGCAEPLYSRRVLPSVSDYRVAGLLVAISQLFTLLAKRAPNTPLLQTLIGIRRNLAFGKLDLEDAKRQIDIALEGMTVSDVLQDEIAKLLSKVERISIHLEAASKEIQAFTASISTGEPGLSEDQRTLLRAVKQSAETHIARIDEIHGELLLRLKKLRRRASMLIGISPETKPEVGTMGAGIGVALQSITDRKNQLVEKIRELDEMSDSSGRGVQPGV